MATKVSTPEPDSIQSVAEAIHVAGLHIQEAARTVVHLLNAIDDAVELIKTPTGRQRDAVDRILTFRELAIKAAKQAEADGERVEVLGMGLK